MSLHPTDKTLAINLRFVQHGHTDANFLFLRQEDWNPIGNHRFDRIDALDIFERLWWTTVTEVRRVQEHEDMRVSRFVFTVQGFGYEITYDGYVDAGDKVLRRAAMDAARKAAQIVTEARTIYAAEWAVACGRT